MLSPFFDPSIEGFGAYRGFGTIHTNCVTGLLHTFFMPIAVCGFFAIVHAVLLYLNFGSNFGNCVKSTCKEFDAALDRATWSTKLCMTMLVGLVAFFNFAYQPMFDTTFYQPITGILTCYAYWRIINASLNQCDSFYRSMTERIAITASLCEAMGFMLFFGGSLLGASICVMEFFGHWVLENHSSDLTMFINSVYHTPLYGTLSLIYPFTGQCKLF